MRITVEQLRKLLTLYDDGLVTDSEVECRILDCAVEEIIVMCESLKDSSKDHYIDDKGYSVMTFSSICRSGEPPEGTVVQLKYLRGEKLSAKLIKKEN